MDHKGAFFDMVRNADWASGAGEFGYWTYRELAERWGWAVSTVMRFMAKCEQENMIRVEREKLARNYIVLTRQWNFDGVSLPEQPARNLDDDIDMLMIVVSTMERIPHTDIRRRMNSREGRRLSVKTVGPAEKFLYLLVVACGHSVQTVCRRYDLGRHSVQRILGRIEEIRDTDKGFDMALASCESAFRAAEHALRRRKPADG